MESLAKITAFLDRELKLASFQDASHNGLQVESTGRVRRVCCGVDASMAFFEAAHARDADLLICHHGISWGDSLARITELNYRRLKFLLAHDMALYACHLPLDAHPVYGNNACIAKALGLRALKPFGDYHGQTIGVAGRLPKPMPYADFKIHAAAAIGTRALQSMDFGGRLVRTVAVVSGGAADMAAEAGRSGMDVYITGEPMLQAHSVAEEYRLNVIFAGHYATEVFGVRALGSLLEKHFAVKSEFIDLAVPY
jgi:dinuclear metal center YbgI/SA1388 family protein